MHLSFLLKDFLKNENKDALIWNDKIYKYSNLLSQYQYHKNKLQTEVKLKPQNVVALKADYSPVSIAVMLALIDLNCIIVPMNYYSNEDVKSRIEISEAEFVIEINPVDNPVIHITGLTAHNKNFEILKTIKHPGIVLFSSGTTGVPKAALHDFILLLDKFKTKRKSYRTINFLLFDHWGGLNTMFNTLSNSGTVIALSDRNPDNVCRNIEKHKAQLLPATPTFLNLLLINEAFKRYNLNSLEVITYGTEPMPESILKKLSEKFPAVKLQQTYGLIETGVMSTKSKDNDSIWVKLGGEGFETRVVDKILQIKSRSSILSYLNYPSPFTEDGWFITGDEVEQDGEYFKILGRKSEMINVGGEKVFPVEVESVIKELDGINEVRVYGEKNPLTGNIVCAVVSIKSDIDKSEFRRIIKKHCNEKLQRFKVPAKINFTDKIEISSRFKKKPAISNG